MKKIEEEDQGGEVHKYHEERVLSLGTGRGGREGRADAPAGAWKGQSRH